MSIIQADQSTHPKPLRLAPGVVIVTLQWLGRFVLPWIVPATLYFGVIGGVVGGLALGIWWVFFSRAPRGERFGFAAFVIVAMVATSRVIDVSIRTGMMGMMFPLYAVPVVSLAFVVGVALSRRLPDGPRRAAMAASVVIGCAAWTLVRTAGMTGAADSDFAWRWSATPEDRLLVQASGEPSAIPSVPLAAETAADWPGFRGAERDGVVRGARIATDWAASPPVELWRRPIGPGWSSFAVRGDRLFTQEQRGEEEVVSCYSVTTGVPLWTHRDAARFWESNAGAGPRGTPSLGAGRVYSVGATGIVNVLEATDGAVVWSRNAASDTKAKIPSWGFASSPLVIDDVVVVATAGALVAYDLATGAPRWIGEKRGGSYSSPHRVTLAGVTQILMVSGPGVVSVAPADGQLLWQHPLPDGSRIVQPAVTADGDLLLSEGDGGDMHRIAIAHGDKGWTVEERWTSDGLKPYFNDFVVHEGHAYGFDASTLACIDLANGMRLWEGGSYGNGQLVVLPDQDLLVVVSEQGELALVGATPERFTELARFPAITGKTWNHPVLVGDVLLARNDQEMVAFRLSLAGG